MPAPDTPTAVLPVPCASNIIAETMQVDSDTIQDIQDTSSNAYILEHLNNNLSHLSSSQAQDNFTCGATSRYFSKPPTTVLLDVS